MKKTLLTVSLLSALAFNSYAADYVIDTKGAHASINFKIQHLGYSWLTGRFNDFDGKFSYDAAKPAASSVNVTINTESFDSNHADRDKHIKGDDFLHVSKYPQAKFVSTKVEDVGAGNLKIFGNFTLHGVTNSIVIEADKVGEGKDPWGGERAGFEGTTRIALADYGITYNLGPASTHVELTLQVEGVKQ
ncbi:YceI family protein [Paraglaciecola sp.]|uniref:YceI family protein n=1 Tax=Paraglaciecola sp. TaxID=1920173 RepID=UPI0030F37D32